MWHKPTHTRAHTYAHLYEHIHTQNKQMYKNIKDYKNSLKYFN